MWFAILICRSLMCDQPHAHKQDKLDYHPFHLTATLVAVWYPVGWLEVSSDAAALSGSLGLLKAVLRTGTNVMLQLI